MATALINTDNLLIVDELYDVISASYINDATVTATVTDLAGTQVSGQTWPATLSYVSASNGKYYVILDEAVAFTANQRYKIELSITGDADLKRNITLYVRAIEDAAT